MSDDYARSQKQNIGLLNLVRQCTSTKTRRLLLLLLLVNLATRFGVVGVALAVSMQRYDIAGVVSMAAVVLGFAQRVITSYVRVATECDAHRQVARTLLESDLFETSAFAVRHAVDVGIWDLQELVTSGPNVIADGVVSLSLIPVVALVVPSRVLVVVVVVLVVIFGASLPFRRSAFRLQSATTAARIKVADSFSLVVEGRVELVAMGAESGFQERFEQEVARYSERTRRNAFGTALVGRAPLVIAAGVIGVIVAFDVTTRSALTDAIERWALLLGASLPPVFGLLLGAQSLVRATAKLGPLFEVMGARLRQESGTSLPTLPSVVRVENVAFAYGGDGAAPLFEEVTFEWKPGEVLLLAGPNGSGKSTLFRLFLGLRSPTVGTIRVGGVELAALDVRALRKRTAYLPQRPYLGESHVAVREAFRLGRTLPSDADCLAAMKRMRLDLGSNPLDRRVGELSGGQRQRLALSRALLQDADVFLLDEPDANLDREGVELTLAVVRDLAHAGKLVALAAHSSELAVVADQTVMVGTAVP